MSHKKKIELKPTARLYSRHVSLGIIIPENFGQDLFRLIQQNIPFCFKGFRNPAEKGYIILEFEILGTAETRLNKILESFCKEKDIVFDKPIHLRAMEEIQQACTRAQRAVDVTQKEIDLLIPGPLHKKEILRKRFAIDQGILHALSWVLNQEGIGEIAPV